MDFIYERIKLPGGIKLETVTGGSHYKGKVWLEIARQIYCENGRDDYREIGHFASGAPFIYGEDARISISHTDGCLAVATLPAATETSLAEFSPETALGVDVEKADREKVAALRERFLTSEEMLLVPENSLEANIIAWTCKEAMLKAFMDPHINWRSDIIITRLPGISTEGFGYGGSLSGEGYIKTEGSRLPFRLHSFRSDGFIYTIATYNP